MRKLFLPVGLFILIINCVEAQWTTSGTNIYNSNTGNVGIGTTTPGAKLVVNGNARVVSNLSIGADEDGPGFFPLYLKGTFATIGFNVSNQGTDQKIWAAIANANQFRIITENDVYGAIQEGMILTRTGININSVTFPHGNFGIGTTTPQSELHLVGNGSSKDAIAQYNGDFIIQSNTGSRSTTTGAQLEFAIPANTDGTNVWGQGRIITVAGNTTTGSATGKMIFGTRRSYSKLGTGTNWYYGDDITIDGSGNVGIGTTAPQALFHVNGNSLMTQGSISLTSGNSTSTGGYSSVSIGSTGLNTSNGYSSIQAFYSGVGYTTPLVLQNQGGNVLIGKTSQANTGYMLDVAGNIRANKVVVNTTGADFVFEPSYQLKPLNEVAAFIQSNHHLPGIEPASAMQKNGVDVGDNQTKLLQKIEELTLYLIVVKKENDLIKKQNKAITERLNMLESNALVKRNRKTLK